MARDDDRYKEALEAIAELARAATDGAGAAAPRDGGNSHGSTERTHGRATTPTTTTPTTTMPFAGCRIQSLPSRLTESAAQMATKVNPINAPLRQPMRGASAVPSPLSIAVSTTRYWGPAPRELSVSFMDSPDAALRRRILEHMNAWATVCGISFVETSGIGQVRIAREAMGHFSYLGTDIGLIPADRQTMNLQGFTMDTADAEFFRVIRHETGHTLGFPHEHMRGEIVRKIDPEKAYPFFLQTQGWDKATVDAQVLTPLDDASIFGTPVDDDSIMCYQLEGSITVDGQPIPGGTDITTTDFAFAAAIYPKVGATAPRAMARDEVDWELADDVLLPA